MQAMVMEKSGAPLVAREVEAPVVGRGQLAIEVRACAVCRTDLHVVDGDLTEPKLPLVPGHEIVGRVVELGDGVEGFTVGDRVGVPWLGWTCGKCAACRRGEENLCPDARFTGYDLDGGYAERSVADARFCFPLPDGYDDVEAAPLLCAGLIGYRSLSMCGDASRVGIYGFGAAAHLIAQVALWQGRELYAFTRPGDDESQAFARSLGVHWAGGSDETPPEALDAAILFAPVGALVPVALGHLRWGGIAVCGGIHMSDIPAFPYELLWHERKLCSVANLSRRDAEEFLKIAPQVPVRCRTETFPLEEANEALDALRRGRLEGAAVLVV